MQACVGTQHDSASRPCCLQPGRPSDWLCASGFVPLGRQSQHGLTRRWPVLKQKCAFRSCRLCSGMPKPCLTPFYHPTFGMCTASGRPGCASDAICSSASRAAATDWKLQCGTLTTWQPAGHGPQSVVGEPSSCWPIDAPAARRRHKFGWGVQMQDRPEPGRGTLLARQSQASRLLCYHASMVYHSQAERLSLECVQAQKRPGSLDPWLIDARD